MARTIRGLLIGLAVLVVVAVALSDWMEGTRGPGFVGSGSGARGMTQGQGWTWVLAAFTFGGVLVISLALVARALGWGRRRGSPRDGSRQRRGYPSD
jgi:protein-S-isoprenylcysteine O-methyltransferase Ste14